MLVSQLDGTSSKNNIVVNVKSHEWSGNLVKNATTMATPTAVPAEVNGGNFIKYAAGTALLAGLYLS